MNASGIGNAARSALVGRILGLLAILTVAVSSGAVIGIANATNSSPAAPTKAAPKTVEPPSENFQATLAVQEPTQTPAAAAVSGGPAQNPGRAAGIPVLNLNIPTSTGGGSTRAASNGKAVKCSRFDDPKISWLLEQVAKTRAEHPEMAAGADKLSAELRAALGKNMCASEAQEIIAQLCTDPAVVRVLNQMVSQLPFFIKPMVGNPCTADLVSVLNKAGKFVPGLSSEPS